MVISLCYMMDPSLQQLIKDFKRHGKYPEDFTKNAKRTHRDRCKKFWLDQESKYI